MVVSMIVNLLNISNIFTHGVKFEPLDSFLGIFDTNFSIDGDNDCTNLVYLMAYY